VSTDLDAAYEYCRLRTKQGASNFYYGFALLPAAQRRAVYAVYAFARECDDLVDGDLPPEEAARRLGQYRAALERCLAGDADGAVFEALSDVARRYGVAGELLFDLIRGVEMDLTVRRYASFSELQQYCGLVASTMGQVCISIFGHNGHDEAREHAASLGIALQLTNILRDVREDADRGRIYLPLEDLRDFGYSEEELLAGETTSAFRGLMAYQVERARMSYVEGARLLPYLPRRARACVGVMAGVYRRILEEIGRDPGVVFRRRVGVPTSRKLALAGRELVRSLAL